MPWNRGPAGAQQVEQVLAHLGLHRAVPVAAGAQLAEGGGGGSVGHDLDRTSGGGCFPGRCSREDGGVRTTTGVRCGDGLGRRRRPGARRRVGDRRRPGRRSAARRPDLAAGLRLRPRARRRRARRWRGPASSAGAATVLGCSAPGVIGGGRGVELTSAVSVWLARLPGVLAAVVPPRGAADLGGDRGASGCRPRRADDRAAVLLVDPYSFPVDAFVEQANDSLPGLPDQRRQRVRAARAPARPGCSSTAWCTTAARSGVVLGGALALPDRGQPGLPAGRPDDDGHRGRRQRRARPRRASRRWRSSRRCSRELPPDEQAMVTTGLHLGVAMDEYADEHGPGGFLVRGVVGADAGARRPRGRRRRRGRPDRPAAGARRRERRRRPAARCWLDVPPGRRPGALLFSCTGRGADAVRQRRPRRRSRCATGWAPTGVAGFFAAGEIGPVAGRSHLHGFTASVLAFLDEPGGDDPERLAH